MNLSIKQKLPAPLFILTSLFFFLAINNGKSANINRSAIDTTKDIIYSQVDVQPQYPGGLQALSAFIKQNLKYPADDAKNLIHGPVFCVFVVEKDGTLSNIKALRSPTAAMSKEAIRVLSLLPAFKPGYKGGNPVRTYFTMPVMFSINK
jgi:protein TonB